jgi:hypothetical protein
MTDHNDNTCAAEPRAGADDGSKSSAKVTSKPNAEIPAPGPTTSQAMSGPGASSTSLGNTIQGDNSQLIIQNILNTSPRNEDQRAQTEWADPSHPLDKFPMPFTGVSTEELDFAKQELATKHVLVITCIDSELQWAVVSAVFKYMNIQSQAVLGVLSGSSPERNDAAKNGTVEEDFAHWTPTNIKRIGGESCVLLLELEGARGQGFIDCLFRTSGQLENFSSELRKWKKYLILLPRGSVVESLQSGHATRGFVVKPLQVEWLKPWLHRHFSEEDAKTHAAKIRELRDSGAWNKKEELIYEWLCSAGTGEAVQHGLQQLAESGDPNLLELIERVKEALDCTDGKDELLLTVVFVATFLRGLNPYDFVRTVEKLLEGRTRDHWVKPPDHLTDSSTNLVQVQIPLAKEWRDGLRPIMKSAHLEQRSSAGSGKIIDFRGLRAVSELQPLLENAPVFLDQQLERIRATGLLFDRSDAISQEVINLVAMAVAQAPNRYDSDWLLGMLLRIDIDQQDIPFTEDTKRMHLEALGNRHLSRAEDLLRRLLADKRSVAELGVGDQIRRQATSIVDQIFEKMIRIDFAPVVNILLDLTWRLQNAPDFDMWYWLHQALERRAGEAQEKADKILQHIFQSEMSDALADFNRLKSWLPESGQSGGVAAATAQRIFANWGTDSIRFASGIRERKVSAHANFLQRLTGKGGAETLRSLVAALLRPDIMKMFHPLDNLRNPKLIELVVQFLLPPESDSLAENVRKSLVGVVVCKWFETEAELPRRFGNTSLHKYLLPALTLTSWHELFAEQANSAQTMATELRSTLDEERRTSVQIWFGLLREIIEVSESELMGQLSIGDTARSKVLSAMVARRERMEQFQTEVNRSSQRGVSP